MAKSKSQKGSVLYVIGSLDVGGTERHVTAVASRLARRGWNISVYTMTHRGMLADELERSGVEVIVPPFRREPSLQGPAKRLFLIALLAFDLFFVMLRRRPTIVHCFLPSAYLVGVPLAAISGCKVRIMSRRSLNQYQQARRLFGAIEIRVHRLVTAALGNSRAVVKELKQEGIPAAKIGLIYNGVDLAPYAHANPKSALRARLGIGADELVIISVANLIPYKGHADLLNALALAGPQMKQNWRVLIAGRDDGIGAELQSLAKNLCLSGNVRFLGLRDDVPDLLCASDVGVLCSHQEGFANAILEGMAAHLPMIVTNVGGNAEAVEHERTGLVVSPGQPEELSDAILRMARDVSLREEMGAAGLRRVTDNFQISRVVSAYDDLYSALIADDKPSSVTTVALRC